MGKKKNIPQLKEIDNCRPGAGTDREKKSQRTIANVSGVQGGLQGVQGRGLNEKLVKGRKIVYVHSQLESWVEIF